MSDRVMKRSTRFLHF